MFHPSPRGLGLSSVLRRRGLRHCRRSSLSLVIHPGFHGFHFPASLGSTVVTRFLATTDALTPAGRLFGPLSTVNTACPRRVSLIISLDRPTILSPTIGATTGDRPAVRRFGLLASRPLYRLRQSIEGSPVHADRIEFTAARPAASLCYGRVVLVPVLPTPPRGDAVPVRYRTALRRTGADFHRSIPSPSQAHDRGVYAASTFHVTSPSRAEAA